MGSDWVQLWLGSGLRRVSLSSDWVQIWFGSGLWRFRLGSDWVAFGSEGNSEPFLLLICICVALRWTFHVWVGKHIACRCAASRRGFAGWNRTCPLAKVHASVIAARRVPIGLSPVICTAVFALATHLIGRVIACVQALRATSPAQSHRPRVAYLLTLGDFLRLPCRTPVCRRPWRQRNSPQCGRHPI